MAHSDKNPEYTANKCPICGGRHETGAAEGIINTAIKEVILGSRTPQWFRSTMEGLYDGQHELKLIARITERLEGLKDRKKVGV